MLALIRADGQSDIAQAIQDLGQVARRGTAVVIITPNNDAAWLPAMLQLAQRGISCTAVLLDPDSYHPVPAGAGIERSGHQTVNLQQLIRRLGMDCHVIHKGEIGRPAVETERHGYWEFKITPSGRAITVRNPLEEGG
jgi:hypothetical protein